MRTRVMHFVAGATLVLVAAGFAAYAIRHTRAAPSAVEPDAVAFLAISNLEDGHYGAARDRLDWLAKRGPGWGLSEAWDAFQDGSVNPASTVYSYTTAIAGLAFADAYERLHDRRYLKIARQSAELLVSSRLCCWRSGDQAGVWYSDQPADQKPGYRVYNVTGLALALLGRLHMHQQLATKMTRGLLAARTRDGWRYMNGQDKPNDLTHAVYIVLGLQAVGARTAARGELNRLWRLYLPGGTPTVTAATSGSHGWGPSAGLWALVAAHECGRASELARNLTRPEDPRGAAVFTMARAMFARRCG
jgi:hypothetical protein